MSAVRCLGGGVLFLSARKKREPKTQTTRTTPGRRRRKTLNGRNPGVERVERLVRLNVEKHLMRKMNAMTTTSPNDASSRGKRDVGGVAWTTTFREEVEKRLKRVADEARKTNTKPSRAFTGWLREEKRDFRATDDTSAFLERCEGIVDYDYDDDDTTPTRGLPSPNEANVRALFADQEEESFCVLLVPGLWGHHYPGYYSTVRDAFRTILGVECEISRVNSEGTVRENAKTIADEIEKMWDETKKKRVVAMGHSKGGLDIAAALALEEKRLEEKLAGFVCVQSPYGGSPIAEDLLSNKYVRSGVHLALEAAFGERRNSEAIQKMVKPVEDLTYRARIRFLKKHPLPEQFRDKTVCFHSKTTSKDSTMANIALYVSSQYNEEGDGLVCRSDAEIPHTRVVRYEDEFDHVDPAFPTSFSDKLVEEHREFYAKENERRIKSGNKMLLPTPLSVKLVELTSQVLAVPGKVKHDAASVHLALAHLALTRSDNNVEESTTKSTAEVAREPQRVA